MNEIEVLYKCKCMAEEAAVIVPHRRPDEDIRDWMHDCVQLALYIDHRRRSPNCQRQEMEYAKLPVPENAPFIGAKPILNS